jgi:hypothetical protein
MNPIVDFEQPGKAAAAQQIQGFTVGIELWI